MRDSRWLFGVFSGCALTGSLVLLALAVREDERALKASSKKAIGTVVERRTDEIRTNGHTTTLDWEVYEFETYMGQSVHFSAVVPERAPKRKVGDRVDVLYPLATPEHARIDVAELEHSALYLLWCSPIGLVLAGFSAFGWRRSRAASARALGWAEGRRSAS